jgi:SAM-dependent methyltransferase
MDSELIRAESRLQGEGWWFRGKADIVRSLLPPPSGNASVLDVGCGWGAIASVLRPWGRVLGVDRSEAACEEAERRGVEVVRGSAESLPVESGSMDIVLATDVLEHLDDDVAAARELQRVLKPGGLALVTVPAYKWLFGAHDRALEHRRRYTKQTIRSAIEAGGLEPERITHFNTLLLPLGLPARLARRRGTARAESAHQAPGPLNGFLYRVFRSERALLRRIDLPVGLSIAVLARPGAEAAQTMPRKGRFSVEASSSSTASSQSSS